MRLSVLPFLYLYTFHSAISFMDALKNNLSEIIGYIKYKVDNDLCTPEEIESVSRMAMENLELYGTIEDMAKFYGVPESMKAEAESRLDRELLGILKEFEGAV